jgi:hypothetical protein
MSLDCVKRAKTAFAEESGRIAALVEKSIQTGTLWPLKRIPEARFDTSLGESPRSLRMSVVPPTRTEYTPILAEGNKATNFIDPLTGETIAGFSDKTGRGQIPGETILWGYEEFGRCLRATALETDPINLLDMLQKKAVPTTIETLRKKLPEFGKEHFANELLRQVIRHSYHKWSAAPGEPMSTNVATFPAVPTGGLNVGMLRKIENVMRRWGWDEGAQTPMVNGRPALQVYAGRDSIDFAITQRKLQKGISIQQSSTTALDGTFGDTEIYEGIQFIENPLPQRGYVVETSSGNYEFREISPWVNAAGTEGIIPKPNPDYLRSFVNVGGESHVVIEVGYIIHPTAMERQALGSMPTIDGKTVRGKFNFEVSVVDDWAIVDPRCNKDKFWLQYRMLHAYAPFPYNPELMTAFLYIAATPQTIYVNPNSGAPITPTLNPITMQPFTSPKVDECTDCTTDTADARSAVLPTCDDLFPENGVGVMRFTNLNYDVDESAVGLTVVVERVGGSVGAATVAYATANGTAAAGTEYTAKSGTLSWADGEFGKKSFVVAINETSGDDAGKTFTVELSDPTGATLGTPSTATVTILDADEA